MGKLSRDKGATYERQIARELFDLTGIKFARNLRQYQASGDDDLRADCDNWPFSIECKRYASAKSCRAGWKAQAQEAAERAGKLPCVVWRGDRMETRVSVPLVALCEAMPADQWADLSLEGFAELAREIMAGRTVAKMIEHRGAIS